MCRHAQIGQLVLDIVEAARGRPRARRYPPGTSRPGRDRAAMPDSVCAVCRGRSGSTPRSQSIRERRGLAAHPRVRCEYGDAGRDSLHIEHAGDRARGLIVDRAHCAAKCRRARDRSVCHVRTDHVDAEARATDHLEQTVEPPQQAADAAKIRRLLEHDVARWRGSVPASTASSPYLARCPPPTTCPSSVSKQVVAIPQSCRGAGEHGARRRARPCAAARSLTVRAHAAAGELHRNARVVKGSVDRRELDPDAARIDINLLAENLREARVDTLTHLRLREPDGDRIVGRDVHERIRGKARAPGGGDAARSRSAATGEVRGTRRPVAMTPLPTMNMRRLARALSSPGCRAVIAVPRAVRTRASLRRGCADRCRSGRGCRPALRRSGSRWVLACPQAALPRP